MLSGTAILTGEVGASDEAVRSDEAAKTAEWNQSLRKAIQKDGAVQTDEAG